MQGNGQFATDSHGRTRTSDGDPRIGMFPQTLVTTGDTACSVKGVLRIACTNSLIIHLELVMTWLVSTHQNQYQPIVIVKKFCNFYSSILLDW